MLNTFVTLVLLLITTGIPFYFQYWLKTASREIPEVNAQCSRMIVAILVCLYLFSLIAGQAGSKIGFGACILSFYFLFHFRGKRFQEVRKVEVSHKDRLIHSVRRLVGFAAFYGFYFLLIHFFSPVTGTLFAVAVAMTSLIFAAPMLVRIWFSSAPMYPSELKDEIVQIFKDAGVQINRVYLMDTDRLKVSNAMVCGSKYGFGPFSRSLFLTQNIFELLDHEELRAVICHEASHFKLHHLAKRGAASFFAFLLGMLAVGFPITLLSLLFSGKGMASSTLGLMVVGNLLFQYAFIFRVIRKQEFEADIHASVLGSDPLKLISALEKITRLNGGSEKKEDGLTRIFMGSGHPSLEERREAILAGVVPSTADVMPEKRWIVSYAGALAILIAVNLINRTTNYPSLERSIASDQASDD